MTGLRPPAIPVGVRRQQPPRAQAGVFPKAHKNGLPGKWANSSAATLPLLSLQQSDSHLVTGTKKFFEQSPAKFGTDCFWFARKAAGARETPGTPLLVHVVFSRIPALSMAHQDAFSAIAQDVLTRPTHAPPTRPKTRVRST